MPAIGADLVKICDDAAPWPPYTYPAAKADGADPDARTGAMVDFLDAIMKRAGLQYSVKLDPWERCIKELKVGRTEVMIGAAFNEKRDKFAYFTKPTHKSTQAIFYFDKYFPDGIDWDSPADTEKFTVCRIRGFNYSEVMLSDSNPAVESKNVEIALQHMRRGRCQILFSSVEPIMGAKLYGDSIVPEGIRYQEYAQKEPNDYHIMVSKASPRGEDLLLTLDEAISQLIKDGTRDRIFDSYYQLMEK
ncbi:MAG: substrate-binding periplasmic protein [Magnetovibrionaceae bacterium]